MKTTTRNKTASLNVTMKRLGRVLSELEVLVDDPNAKHYHAELAQAADAAYNVAASLGVDYAKASAAE